MPKKPRICMRLVVNCDNNPTHRCCQYTTTTTATTTTTTTPKEQQDEMALTEAEEALAAAEIALTEVKEFMVADSVAGNVALGSFFSRV